MLAQCTPTRRQYKQDTLTGWGNSSCMATNQTWNVYVVYVWESVWICTLEKKQGTALTLIHMWCLVPFHVFLHHRVAERACCHPLTKDTDIEQDKTLTFHQHLSCALLFSHPFSSFFWHDGIPQSCGTLTVCWWEVPQARGTPTWWREIKQNELKRGISTALMWWKSFRHSSLTPGHSAFVSMTAFKQLLSSLRPHFHMVLFNDLYYSVKKTSESKVGETKHAQAKLQKSSPESTLKSLVLLLELSSIYVLFK